MLTFGFYLDPALTTPVAARPQFVQAASSPVAEDKVVYFGSPNAGRIAKAASDPGVDAIAVSIVDSASGAGSPAGDVRLALSAGGLATATPSAPLSLGVDVAGGVAEAVPVYLRVLDSTHTLGRHTDLSISCNLIAEFAT